MAVALETFVKHLTDSGVIAPGKLENFIPPKAAPKDAQELARQLVQSKHLTKFQAQEIYQGRAKSLILGNYTILDKIGAGGMGQVFKAEHRRMKRIVAIKVLPKAVTKDAAAIARFQREVEAAAKLSHPNIVTAHDADEANGINFLVMEYVEAADLSALVKRDGPLSVAKVVNYILQAARGLEFAHGEGVVHRDIKPANLLLDKKGTVKILDMGLARIDAGGDSATQAELTGTGAVLGTVDYMAPEQALSTKHAHAQADIYSLGCTLFYLVTAKPAYDGDSLMAKLLAHREQPIPSLGTNVPQQVQAVFEKMVAKDVQDRYQTMSEVVAALEKCNSEATSLSLQQPVGTSSSSDVMTFLRNVSLNTINRPKPKSAATPIKKPIHDKIGPKSKKPVLGAIAAGLLGLAVLAGVVIKTQTKDGTLVVEINQPDAVVEVLNEEGKVEITQPGKKGKVTLSVDPGKHRLKIEKDGFVVFGQDFVIESGGTQAIKATLETVKKVSAGVAAAELGKPIDLLKLIDLKRDICRGDCKIDDGTLVMSRESILNIPYLPPPEYQITITATRIGPAEALGVCLPIGTQRTLAGIDSAVYGSGLYPNRQKQDQPYFRDGVPATVVYTVRNSEVELIFNGQVLTHTSPGPKPLLWPGYSIYTPAPLFIASWASFQITKLELLPLDRIKPGHPLKQTTAVADPGFEKWLDETLLLPVKQQVETVAKKLQELNPGFDGECTPEIEDGEVTALTLLADKVRDISPVRAFVSLKALRCRGSGRGKGILSDLSPLATMKLTKLDCGDSMVFDFTPLKESRLLTTLFCDNTPVYNLSPLKQVPLKCLDFSSTFVFGLTELREMPLTEVSFDATQVFDLSPLKGMPLTKLEYDRTSISDHSPVRGMPLTIIRCEPRSQSDVDLLRTITTLTTINDKPTADFWRDVAAKQAEFKRWIKIVATMPAQKQVEAVGKKLQELNPEFDGTVKSQIENGVVAGLEFCTDYVTDISPVRALPELKGLNCGGSEFNTAQLTDFSPLIGMKLTTLTCNHVKAPDLSPLHDLPLEGFVFEGNEITDVGPLSGLPLTHVGLFASVRLHDITPLESCKSLKYLGVLGTKVSPARVARFHKAVPDCKISWKGDFKYDTPITTYIDPAFKQWEKEVANLPAEEQVKSVVKKLRELNPKFDGRHTPRSENGVVTDFVLEDSNNVTDISPVRALTGLKHLRCNCGLLWDLSPLKGMRLKQLEVYDTLVSDLSPLKGMPLVRLNVSEDSISDLSPLEGMHLEELWCGETLATDLTALKEMPLTLLAFDHTDIADVSPLQGMNLQDVYLSPGKIAKGIEVLRQMKTMKSIGIDWDSKWPPIEFWKKYDAGDFGKPKAADAAPAKPITTFNDPAFKKWEKEVAKLPAEEQIKAVVKKLQELNPGFDGKETHKIEGGVVTALRFVTDNVIDISPIRALSGLKLLDCLGSNLGKGQLSDLSPVVGLPLVSLNCGQTKVSDLSPLSGLPLNCLMIHDTKVSDLSPLAGMPLKILFVYINPQLADLSPLNGLHLTNLNCGDTAISDLSPLKGMPLDFLDCNHTQVIDLSPLHRMPLRELSCNGTSISDLSPVKDCNGLKSLNVTNTRVTATAIAILQNALPNCKIEWDDPSKK